jgi:hypothetical protein
VNENEFEVGALLYPPMDRALKDIGNIGSLSTGRLMK